MRLDDSYRGQYIWAYNAALTEYCCHNDEAGLGQADCCDGGTFELPAPGSGSSSASASASASTSTPVSSTSTTTTSSSTLASAPSESGTPSTTAATASLSTGAKRHALGLVRREQESSSSCWLRCYSGHADLQLSTEGQVKLKRIHFGQVEPEREPHKRNSRHALTHHRASCLRSRHRTASNWLLNMYMT